MALEAYRGLEVWQVAMDLVEDVYRSTRLLPPEEKFGLCRQLRDAVISIPSNIAEGYGRCHRGDYVHHLSFGRGSAMEVETQLLIAQRLGYLTPEQLALSSDLCRRVISMLTKLIASLQTT